MLAYYILFAFATPLLGIWLMEQGEYGPSIGRNGYPNGASVAYVLCWMLLLAVAYWVATLGRRRGGGVVRVAALQNEAFREYATKLVAVLALFLVIHLFLFGGIDVLRGAVGKEEFRTTLGPFGAAATMLVKFIAPAMLGYAAFLYRASAPSWSNAALLFLNVAIAATIGAAWGAKSTSAAMLMPMLMFLFWRVRIAQLAVIGVLVFGSFVAFSFMFDVQSSDLASALDFVWKRLTVLQGDVPWYTWDQTITGADLPSYGKTLLAVLGDHTLTLFGLDIANYSQWVDYHYGLLLTEFIGAPLDQIASGYNVTGTYFTEGLFAGGVWGAVLFSVLGGCIVGFVVRKLVQARDANRPLAAALWATYFAFYVFPWLYSGGITQFVHPATLVGMLVSGICIRLLTAVRIGVAGEAVGASERVSVATP